MKDDPRYTKYFKMVTIGIPLANVKQKMMIEGVCLLLLVAHVSVQASILTCWTPPTLPRTLRATQ